MNATTLPALRTPEADILSRFEPLTLLILFRAIVASFELATATELRTMSLADAMTRAAQAKPGILAVHLLMEVGGLDLEDANRLFDAAIEIERASLTLSLVPEPNVRTAIR